jgi:hypothetical protein
MFFGVVCKLIMHKCFGKLWKEVVMIYFYVIVLVFVCKDRVRLQISGQSNRAMKRVQALD